MSTMSTNLNLELQAPGERASLTVLNANLGKIDDFAGDAMKLINFPAYGNDCNDIDENCTVYVTDTATHSPSAWSIMSTYVFDASNAIWQIAMSVVYGTLKTRYKNGNGWSEWVEMVNSGLTLTSLFSGALLSGNEATLSDSISNYQFVLLVFQTNAEMKTQLIPTSIARSKQIQEMICGASASGETTFPPTYNSSTIVSFTADNKVSCTQLIYNNSNYVCKLVAVYGVIKK